MSDNGYDNSAQNYSDDVDYDDAYDGDLINKRKIESNTRDRIYGESGIPEGELSELEDDEPIAGRKRSKKNGPKMPSEPKAKKPGRKKAYEIEAEADQAAQELQKLMVDAYAQDMKDFEDNGPGLNRFTLLPTINSIMGKAYNQNSLLETGILQEIRLFLEPLPDGTLPIINIQRDLLQFMLQMPITIEFLRSSFVGRVVKFYATCPRITQEVQKMAEQLVSRWTQLVTRQSTAANRRRLEAALPLNNQMRSGAVDRGKYSETQKRLLSAMATNKRSNRKR